MVKVALVTGAGLGIGRASCRSLYQDGYSLVLTGRRREPLKETAEDWDKSCFLIVPADVTHANQVDHLFEETKKQFGRLDVLFNNAGIGSPPLPIDETDASIFQKVMGTNVNGTFLCCQKAWSIMKEQGGGRSINNRSISSHTPHPFSAPYMTAKHAITGLTKSLKLDGRSLGICCSQIEIGNAATPMTERISTTGVLQPNGQVAIKATMPVEIVADTIVYLANLPLEANIPFMTIMAPKMPYLGRG